QKEWKELNNLGRYKCLEDSREPTTKKSPLLLVVLVLVRCCALALTRRRYFFGRQPVSFLYLDNIRYEHACVVWFCYRRDSPWLGCFLAWLDVLFVLGGRSAP
ncbi:unnamed protein product, partial [Ectocarpus fasciculatus]